MIMMNIPFIENALPYTLIGCVSFVKSHCQLPSIIIIITITTETTTAIITIIIITIIMSMI